MEKKVNKLPGIALRMKMLIDKLGFNPNSFSVAIGVHAATTDKIIKGKNNPGYEYLVRVLGSFPEINARWLMLGEGRMFV